MKVCRLRSERCVLVTLIALSMPLLMVSVGRISHADEGPPPPMVVPPKNERVQKLCGISLGCWKVDGQYWHGLLLLPQASIGVAQVPISSTGEGPRFNDGFGNFRPSIGVNLKWWFLEGWIDLHLQVLYGDAPPTGQDQDVKENYLWGASLGLGAPFGVLQLDLAWLDRRIREDSRGVDSGFALLVNIDATALGVLLGTAVE